MNNWTEGYVADVGYTYGYYAELNPLRTRWAFLNAGLVPPKLQASGGTACELGFGQGISAAFHSACSNTQWWGTDFNPAQAGHAMQLVEVAGTTAHFFDQSFAQFCARTDLPDFDTIGLHGIWSWISNENRAIIVDFIQRKLKVGGCVYVSYNTQPGWSAAMPLRHLLTTHAAVMGTQGQGILSRIGDSLAFTEKLWASNPGYLKANPGIADKFNRLKELDKSYLAHEYFNRDWAPMHFTEMAEWLEPAKVTYACSAHLLDHVDGINLQTDQQQILQSIPAGTFRETVRDYCMNQQFRRDYWVKGARQINQLDQADLMRRERIVLVQPAPAVSFKITGAAGEISLKPDVYEALVKSLSDHVPRTVEYVAQQMAKQSLAPQAREAITVLIGTGALQICQDERIATKAKSQTDRLNAYLMNQARAGGINYLVSPLIGGFAVNRSEQLFLLGRSTGLKSHAEWAAFAWEQYKQLGQRLIKEGKTLTEEEDNLKELSEQAQQFASTRLPILKALMIA